MHLTYADGCGARFDNAPLDEHLSKAPAFAAATAPICAFVASGPEERLEDLIDLDLQLDAVAAPVRGWRALRLVLGLDELDDDLLDNERRVRIARVDQLVAKTLRGDLRHEPFASRRRRSRIASPLLSSAI